MMIHLLNKKDCVFTWKSHPGSDKMYVCVQYGLKNINSMHVQHKQTQATKNADVDLKLGYESTLLLDERARPCFGRVEVVEM